MRPDIKRRVLRNDAAGHKALRTSYVHDPQCGVWSERASAILVLRSTQKLIQSVGVEMTEGNKVHPAEQEEEQDTEGGGSTVKDDENNQADKNGENWKYAPVIVGNTEVYLILRKTQLRGTQAKPGKRV